MRLKIGSYIIDSAPSGSTSTTQGARLMTERPGVRWREWRNQAVVNFIVQVERDTPANFRTSRDAIVAALTRTVNADVVYESEPGETFKDWLVSTGAWQRVEGDVMAEDESDSGAAVDGLFLVTLTLSRVAPATGSGGDPAGSLDGVTWSHALEGGGRPGVQASAVFQTREDANLWVRNLRSGVARPAWMGTAYRFVTAMRNIEQQPNQAAPVPEAAYAPCEVTAIFNALPSAWALSAAFADVVDGDCEMGASLRGRLQSEAGARPGLNVTISGRVMFKTEKDEEFDSTDTTVVVPDGLREKTLACFRVMKADLERRRGISEVQLPDGEAGIELLPSPKSGEVFFVAAGVAEFDGVLEFSEHMEVEMTTRDRIMDGVLGGVVFQDELGPVVRVKQSGAAMTSYLYAPQKPPFINDRWLELRWKPTKPVQKPPHEDGMTFYEVGWDGEWVLVSDGGQGARGATTFEEITGA